MQASNGCVQNGSAPSSSNGAAAGENGHPDQPQPEQTSQLSRTGQEIVRLIGQYLKHEGLTKSLEVLMSESGCRLEHPAATRFRTHVLDGDWNKADHDLQELRSLVGVEFKQIVLMKFLLLEQKYLEYLEDGRVLDALHVLRNELTPLQHNTARVHQLSSYMMCATTEELLERTKWEGKGEKSRTNLMLKLHSYLPATVMLPPNRLNTLLTQAQELQTLKCTHHNTGHIVSFDTDSLLSDHCCGVDKFPTHTVQICNDHCDEVWYAQFSPNGLKLATISKDTNVIIWDVNPETCRITSKRILDGTLFAAPHNANEVLQINTASFVQWHPDSNHILVCGPEDTGEVFLWDVEKGTFVKICQAQEDALSCCAFNVDGSKFVTGGIRGQFYQCDLEGNILDSWEGIRVNSLHYRKDNKTVLAADTHHRVRAYVFEDLVDHTVIQEDHPIMSFTVNKDDRLALLNVATQGVHLWDIQDKCLVRRYQGLTQGHFTIHSTFGGANQDFIASGSEDNLVYIWHVNKETPIATLTGHTRTVNCVAWNPVFNHIMVSVSDDCTVRVWGPKDKLPKPSVSSSSSESSSNSIWNEMSS